MRVLAGTSGYAFKEWKGAFYPEALKDDAWLGYYASKFSAVEINNTFYKSPVREQLERWAAVVPEDFVFVLKAPQRITHRASLLDKEEPVARLWEAAQGLGARLGPILFQMPPYLRQDLERLRAFLAALPAGLVPVLEFRHASWNDEATFACLREHGAALCLADTDELPAEDPVGTARHGYLRLRRVHYGPEDLRLWAERVRRQPWDDVFVFFKHEDEGKGPQLAATFLKLAEQV